MISNKKYLDEQFCLMELICILENFEPNTFNARTHGQNGFIIYRKSNDDGGNHRSVFAYAPRYAMGIRKLAKLWKSSLASGGAVAS